MIRVDYERINGRYTNAEYRGKITRCDLTLNIKDRAVRRKGGGAGDGGGANCANYFKIMQIFTRNWVYTPDFGLKISIPFVKPLNSHPLPFQKSAYRPEIISSFKLWTRVLFLKGHSMLKS